MFRYVAILLVLMSAAGPYALAKDSILGAIERTAKRIDTGLCAKFQSKKCKGETVKQKTMSAPKKSVKQRATKPVLAQPEPKPKAQDKVPDEPEGVEEQVEAAVPLTTAPPAKPRIPMTTNACLQNLSAAGAAFAPAALTVANDNCIVPDAVRMTAVTFAGGNIKLPDEPVLSCAFALDFAVWLAGDGNRVVRKSEGASLASITTGPGFECRTRNRAVGAKISEHAKGNAIDIDRLLLTNGQTITVRDMQNPNLEVFDALKALQTSACEHFTTVLAPGSDSAHTDHFHLDMARRKAGYRICQ